MRSIYLRELRELAIPGIMLVAVAVAVGIDTVGPLDRNLDDVLVMPVIAGLLLGVIQGLLDHWRRNDLFFQHRPIPAGRREIARTLAGLTVCALVVGFFVVTHRVATALELADRRLYPGIIFNWEPGHLGLREVCLVIALLLAAWAIARFASGTGRPRWGLFLLVALPLAGWTCVAQVETVAGAALVALLLTALASWGSWLSLVGDRA